MNETVSRRWEIPFSFVLLDLASTCGGNSLSGPVHMIPGQLIVSGQLTDPGSNLPRCVRGLSSVTVHMNFSLPRGNFERPCQGNFSPSEQNAKVAP